METTVDEATNDHTDIMLLSLVRPPPLFSGASTPYKRWSKCSMEKVRGEGFCSLFQEIKGEVVISLLIVALISSANYHLIYCKWLT